MLLSHKCFAEFRAVLFLGLTLVLNGFSFETVYSQQKKLIKGQGTTKAIDEATLEINDVKWKEDEVIEVPVDPSTREITITFETDLEDGKQATEVWTRNYRGEKLWSDLPDIPRGDPDQTQPASSDPTRKWSTVEHASLHSNGENTLAVWLYYEIPDGNHIRYYKYAYPYKAVPESGFAKVTLNGQPVGKEPLHQVKKSNTLAVYTRKLHGRHASEVHLKIVKEEDEQSKKMPVQVVGEDKTIQKTKKSKAFEGNTKQWTFPKITLDTANYPGACSNKIMIWAVYKSGNGIEYRRFSAVIGCSIKKK